jgi:hypothetical protein
MKFQISWLGVACTIPAGLPVISSFAGPIGDFISGTISRIILGYRSIVDAIYERMSIFTGIDFFSFRNEITYSLFMIIPYLFYHKKVVLDGFISDKYKLLSFLNFISIIFIIQAFPINHNNIWFNAMATFFISSFMAWKSYRSLRLDPEYRRILKLSFLIIFSTVAISSQIYLLYSYGFPSPFLIILMIFCGIAYSLGILTRIDGYYPFLFVMIFYVITRFLDYIFVHIAPSVDTYLTAIGV